MIRKLRIVGFFGLVTSCPLLFGQDLMVAEINFKTLASVHPVDTGIPNPLFSNPPIFTFSSDGNTIYSAGGNMATAVDRKTGTLLHTYTLANQALWAAVTPDQSRLFVATCSIDFGCDGNYLEIFDVASAQSLQVIAFDSDLITDVKVSPGGKVFYVTHHFYDGCGSCFAPKAVTIQSNAVTAFSVSTFEPISNFLPPNNFNYPPLNLAITRDGGTGYIAAGSELYKVHLPSFSVVTKLALPISPFAVELSTTGKQLLLGQIYPAQVYFFDTQTQALMGPLTAPLPTLRNAAFSFDGSQVLMSGGEEFADPGNLATGSVASLTVTETGNYTNAGLIEGSPTGGVFGMFVGTPAQ
jgi:hypothetical protein